MWWEFWETYLDLNNVFRNRMNQNIKEIKKNLKKLRYAYDKIMRLENLGNVKDVYRHPTCDAVKGLREKYKKQMKLSDDELWAMIRASKLNKNIFRYNVARYRQITGDFIQYVDFLNELKSFEEKEMKKIEERKKEKKDEMQETIKEIDKEIFALKLKRKEFEEHKKKRLKAVRKISEQRCRIKDMETRMIKRIINEYKKYEYLIELFSDEKLAEFLNPKIGRIKIDRFSVKEIGSMKYLDEKDFRIFYEALEKLTEDEMKKLSRQVKCVDELTTLKPDLKKLFRAMENVQIIRKQRIRCEEEIKRIKDEIDYKEKMIDDEEKKLVKRKMRIMGR
jgi:hypothetical protein